MKRFLIALLRSPLTWIGLAWLAPELAWGANSANSASMFLIPSGDISQSMFLDKIFPSGNEPGPFGALALVLNSALMIGGGSLITYNLIIGTVNTAHDGEMLGKKWSSVWLPIRTSFGAAMMFPLSAKGFCGAQLIMIWVIMQSVGLADTVWKGYSDNFGQSVFATSSVPKDSVREIALQMLRNNTCMASAEKSVLEATSINPASVDILTNNGLSPLVGSTTGYTDRGGFEIQYGIHNDLMQNAFCGRIALEKTEEFVDSGQVSTMGQKMIGQIDDQSQALGQVQSEIWTQQKQSMIAMDASMKKAAADFIYKSSPVLPAVNEAVSTYVMSIQAAAAKAASANPIFKEVAKNAQADGWIGAGGWFIHLANFQQGLAETVSHIPKLAPPQEMNLLLTQVVGGDLAHLETQINNEKLAFTTGPDAQAKMDQGDDGAIFGWVTDFGGHLSKYLIRHLGQGNLMLNGDVPVNPVLAAQALGNKMIDAGWFILTLPALAAVAPMVSQSVTMVILMMTLPIAVALFTGGVMLAWVIPFMPYVYFTFAVLSWMILCIESFFSAPFWAFMHLHGDGDELGQAGPAYKLIFTLFATPTLMILGFCVSLTIISLAGPIIDHGFSSTLDMTRGNYTMGPISILAVIGIYGGLMLGMVHIAFSEIHRFPDRVLRWTGLNQQAISQIAQEGGGHSQKHNTAVVGGVMQTKQGVAQGANSLLAEKRGTAANNAANQRQSTRDSKTDSQAESMVAALQNIGGTSKGGKAGGTEREASGTSQAHSDNASNKNDKEV